MWELGEEVNRTGKPTNKAHTLTQLLLVHLLLRARPSKLAELAGQRDDQRTVSARARRDGGGGRQCLRGEQQEASDTDNLHDQSQSKTLSPLTLTRITAASHH